MASSSYLCQSVIIAEDNVQIRESLKQQITNRYPWLLVQEAPSITEVSDVICRTQEVCLWILKEKLPMFWNDKPHLCGNVLLCMIQDNKPQDITIGFTDHPKHFDPEWPERKPTFVLDKKYHTSILSIMDIIHTHCVHSHSNEVTKQ